MQDFRPRISSTYQPRQSLSHLVSKFENLDGCPGRPNYAPTPRRTKTLPTVHPGQWLASSNLNEKKPAEDPEVPSASTFGQRHKSVAERRKLFEAANAPSTDHSSGTASSTRVFSRDVTCDPSLSTDFHASLQDALEMNEHVESRHSTEAVRQVRRMPRLEVARSRPPPTDELEWPLKSESPLRASFDSYHATKASVEWKPTPARQSSLSRRREVIGPCQIETTQHDTNSSRNSSGETGGLVRVESKLTTPAKIEERPTTHAQSVPKPQAETELIDVASPVCHAASAREAAFGSSAALPTLETIATSIGYPSSHPTSLPASQSHSVLFPSKNSGSWAAKQSSSPLKDKIGIFESLSRQGSIAESTRSVRGNTKQPPPPSQPLMDVSKQASSLSRTTSRIKATFRKISVSWERGHVKRLPSLSKENAGVWSNHQDAEYCQTRGNVKHHSASNTEDSEPISRPSIRRLFGPVSSLSGKSAPPPPTPHNSFHRGTHHKASSAGASSDSTGLLGIFGSDNTTSTQAALVAAAPGLQTENVTESRQPSWGKRWISRSSGSPMFAKVQCKLDHPTPVRGDELKRLVTLCKDSALRRRSRGQTG